MIFLIRLTARSNCLTMSAALKKKLKSGFYAILFKSYGLDGHYLKCLQRGLYHVHTINHPKVLHYFRQLGVDGA